MTLKLGISNLKQAKEMTILCPFGTNLIDLLLIIIVGRRFVKKKKKKKKKEEEGYTLKRRGFKSCTQLMTKGILGVHYVKKTKKKHAGVVWLKDGAVPFVVHPII